MADWLQEEMQTAVRGVRQAHIDRILALGVHREPFCRLGMTQPQFGVMSVRALSDGLYEPDQDGGAAVIIPVMVVERLETILGPIDLPCLVDLIAFQTANPARWQWRIGTGWALGSHLLTEPDSDAVEIVATPLEWMSAGGNAVCVLDWSEQSPAWFHLRTAAELVVSNQILAARLAAGIERATPRPRFSGRAHYAAA